MNNKNLQYLTVNFHEQLEYFMGEKNWKNTKILICIMEIIWIYEICSLNFMHSRDPRITQFRAIKILRNYKIFRAVA